MAFFKVIIVGWQVEKYIDKCLSSLIDQNDQGWEACLVLDPSQDKSYEKALQYASPKLKVFLNETQQYALPNILRCIKELKPQDEDVLVTLDADDWFYSKRTLGIVRNYYIQVSNLLLTHGSWYPYPNPSVVTNNAPYSPYEFKTNIRKYGWRGSHLRTFKYKIWKHVQEADLKDENGNFYRSAWDLAMMWPMLEMAGFERVKFIHELLYVYNQETPYNDSKMRSMEQMKYTDYLASKPQYPYRETF